MNSGFSYTDYIAIGVAVIALIGTIVSSWLSFAASKKANEIALKALKKASDVRIAEFRQLWIENLRLGIADFRAASYRKMMARNNLNTAKTLAEKKKLKELFHQYTEETSRKKEYLRLCLNPEEEEHRKLETKLNEYSAAKKQSERIGLTEISRKILKSEWDRLKSEIT